MSTAPTPVSPAAAAVKRSGPPKITSMRILLAATVLLAVLCVVCVVGMVYLANRIVTVQEQSFAARRSSAESSCDLRETLRADVRLTVLTLGIRASRLPVKPDGTRVFAKPGETCAEYARRIVPESNRP